MISISTALNKTIFRTRTTKTVSHSSLNYFRNAFSILTKAEKRHFRILIVADIFISIVDILSLAFLLGIIQFYVQPQKSFVFSLLPSWMLDKKFGFAHCAFLFYCLVPKTSWPSLFQKNNKNFLVRLQ